MTEITDDNFEEMLPQVREAIKSASFLAIDTEMTGLHASPALQPSLFDSVEDRYRKQRVSASNFIICQFGLSCFKKDLFANKYEAKSYSFYVCPRYSGTNREKVFSMDPGSVEFLCDFSFNFSKFAYQGISYLNKDQERDLRQELDRDIPTVIPNVQSDELFSIKSKISSWLATNSESQEKQIKIPYKPTLNRFVNYLVLTNLRKSFKNVWFEMCDDEVTATLVTSEERSTLMSRMVEDENDAFDYLLGFSRVFKCMVESGKPIVGYNMISDALLMYHHFHEPLPNKLQAFKRGFHELFPVIYDVKSVIHNGKKYLGDLVELYQARNLVEIYQYLQLNSFTLQFLFQPSIVEATSSYSNDGQPLLTPHDAGFDSFITGYCFIRLAHAITMLSSKPVPDPHGIRNSPKNSPSWFDLERNVFEFKNRINLILCNHHYLNLEGREGRSDRPTWLHVESKDKKPVVMSDVTSLVSSYGMVDVKLISPYQALLAISNRRSAQDIVKAFRNGSDYNVAKYNPVKHNKVVRILLWYSILMRAMIAFRT